MTVLEFLTRATGTWVITSRKLILDDGGPGLLGTCVLLCSSLLVLVDQLFLTNLLLRLSILLALGALLWSCLLYLLMHLWDLGTSQD